VRAVWREPVSGAISLLTGKIQGSCAEFANHRCRQPKLSRGISQLLENSLVSGTGNSQGPIREIVDLFRERARGQPGEYFMQAMALDWEHSHGNGLPRRQEPCDMNLHDIIDRASVTRSCDALRDHMAAQYSLLPCSSYPIAPPLSADRLGLAEEGSPRQWLYRSGAHNRPTS